MAPIEGTTPAVANMRTEIDCSITSFNQTYYLALAPLHFLAFSQRSAGKSSSTEPKVSRPGLPIKAAAQRDRRSWPAQWQRSFS